ncbi:hypothetical protein BDU57DRAFT_519290 [Ampelomyces quisqualis]|uniref:HMG box domain-containing protein n=1 Tax=Ampelomyces quisqualis TaxID=50730 RepID=A0A6A5QFM7_AMPQU|nr:hypothetical protein BDU57DRAFT_519290 [Ampelomyces quisqualis]
MAPRAKKEETGELMVSIEQYTRTRDSVILALTNLQTGLTGVQNGLNDLLRAYMQHTHSIVAGEDVDFERLQLPASIAATANAVMEAATATHSVGQAITGSSQTVEGATADRIIKKRKREKKIKDPNAPKKPLTAAFLYAQTARPIVRADLEASLGPGQALEKNAVNLEVTKRWNELAEDEKERWKASYRSSLEDYKVEMAEYVANAGGKVADVHVDEDMSDEGEAEIEVEAEVATIDSDASSSDEEEAVITKAPSPPAKTPRPNKRQKTAAAAANAAIAPMSSNNTTTPVSVPGGRPAALLASTEAPATAKKDIKKKAKAAASIAPAPASSVEPMPEEASKTTKKFKTGRSTRNAEVDVDKENAATLTQDKEKKKRDRYKRKSEVTSV